jgi:glycosyltransferase involved in cell wall biosynthesis
LRPSVSLIITTYRRPDALAAVLNSALAQIQHPDELLVADDGSTDNTAAVIADAARRAPFPLHHLWHRHEGFRLTRTRNMAIAAASSDYLIFVDGDMLLHPMFVADHRRLARRGCFTQGVRVLLDASRTAAQLANVQRPNATGTPRFLSPGLGALRRLYAIHSPSLANLNRRLANNFIAIKGCNQAFWRDDLVATNGFNEDIVGWGPEDKELCARLGFRGIQRQTLLFGGIAFHLDHAPATRERRQANDAVFAATRRDRQVRCERGLDAHGTVIKSW